MIAFESPWEARVFAIAVSLHERGLYTWREWTQALAARMADAQAAATFDVDESCYRHWLDALDDLLARNGIDSAETMRWRDAWQNAAGRTPHGEPLELQPDDFDTGATAPGDS
ncbi:nitrile hydratase accessory protein [Mycobacterium sp. GA-1199]|uniref:nitrile hydratase accessory protein n=1 Tax=Mycobacterium sp. GA-1199 TaxID=1772287 RepID=UPI0018D21EE5|nr:nitrile hydratase accessory protein [Mycobacterium sp. GA-1199]